MSHAATIATLFSTNTLTIVAATDTRTITMTLAEVVDPGTYAWSGSVTVTAITATRIRGTFEASLEPAPGSQATGTLVIASGTIDNGRPPGF